MVNVPMMTYTYACESAVCRASFPEKSFGFKNSCCHKCNNEACPDYGECTCMDAHIDRVLNDPSLLDGMIARLRGQTEEE